MDDREMDNEDDREMDNEQNTGCV